MLSTTWEVVRSINNKMEFMESLFNPDISLKQAGSPTVHYWEISKAFIAECLKSQVSKAAVSKTQQTSIDVGKKPRGIFKQFLGCLNSA